MDARETDPVAIRNLFRSGGSVVYAYVIPHVLILFLQMTLFEREWKWGALTVLLLVLVSRRDSFRFLWRRTAWFRGSLIWQLVIQTGFAIAAIALGNPEIGIWGMGVGATLLLILSPHERRFCEEFGIPLNSRDVKAD